MTGRMPEESVLRKANSCRTAALETGMLQESFPAPTCLT